jgi:Leucine-rich repeat (LRR) protein
MRCKTDKIEAVDKINLWGNELEDVSLIRQMPNLTVISLSVNHLRSLEDFAFCPKLKELYLRKNEIRDINEVQFLKNCPFLDTLWLEENPLCNFPNYRQAILAILPNLTKLDN